jgi:hypothetical protein
MFIFTMRNNTVFYAGVVWLISAAALITFGILALLLESFPGIEQLVILIDSLSGNYIYIAAFLTILIEGLYVIGNFFPGSSSVLILAVLSQFGGTTQFILTIFAIFVGWVLAGAINIIIARKYLKNTNQGVVLVQDKTWATWFPPFRASYEVTQVVEGGSLVKILLSSVRVKLWTCLGIGIIAYLLPNIVDIHEVNNQEGFVSLTVIAIIMIIVGIRKIRASKES